MGKVFSCIQKKIIKFLTGCSTIQVFCRSDSQNGIYISLAVNAEKTASLKPYDEGA